jgi:hypothetical protein
MSAAPGSGSRPVRETLSAISHERRFDLHVQCIALEFLCVQLPVRGVERIGSMEAILCSTGSQSTVNSIVPVVPEPWAELRLQELGLAESRTAAVRSAERS